MENPILLYGVNVMTIPTERRNLPENITIESDKIMAGSLEALAYSYGLKVFSTGVGEEIQNPDLAFVDIKGANTAIENIIHTLDEVHIGIVFEGKVKYGGNFPQYDLEKLIALKQDPSELIEKLKKIGLDVKPEELALYQTDSNY